MTSWRGDRFREGAGRISLDLLRTRRRQGSRITEELPDGAAVIAWITQFAPTVQLDAGRADPDAVERVHAVREAVRALVAAARSDAGVASCPVQAREIVNAAAAHPVPSPELGPDGLIHWVSDRPVPAVVSVIARDALDLVTASATAHRVRECAGPECGALFVDQSAPGRRRWCSMGTCGNRAKKSNRREKVRPDVGEPG